jgi:hypothetical protein
VAHVHHVADTGGEGHRPEDDHVLVLEGKACILNEFRYFIGNLPKNLIKAK